MPWLNCVKPRELFKKTWLYQILTFKCVGIIEILFLLYVLPSMFACFNNMLDLFPIFLEKYK